MTIGFQYALANGGVDFFNGTATANEFTIAVQTTQVAAATRLVSSMNRVTPIAGSTALLLPMNPVMGSPIVVANYGAVAALIYPAWNDANNAASAGRINNAANNAVFSLAAGKTATFYPLPSSSGVVVPGGIAGTDWAVTLSA